MTHKLAAIVIVVALFAAPIFLRGESARAEPQRNAHPQFGVCGSIAFEALAVDQQAVAARPGLRLTGFALRESAGTAAAATFILRNGTSATAQQLVPIELTLNESAREWWWPGLTAERGIYIDRVAGTADVVVFFMEE